MRLIFALIVAFFAVASAQMLGATPPALGNTGVFGPSGSAAPHAGATPGNYFEGRKSEDNKWGKAFDDYNKARDDFKKDPQNAAKKARFDAAEKSFNTASMNRRNSDSKFDKRGEADVCKTTEEDKRFKMAGDAKNAADENRKNADAAWSKSYDAWSKARDEYNTDPKNADKKKRFDDATKNFKEASDRQKAAAGSWHGKVDEMKKAKFAWDQKKGHGVEMPPAAGSPAGMSDPAPSAHLRTKA